MPLSWWKAFEEEETGWKNPVEESCHSVGGTVGRPGCLEQAKQEECAVQNKKEVRCWARKRKVSEEVCCIQDG